MRALLSLDILSNLILHITSNRSLKWKSAKPTFMLWRRMKKKLEGSYKNGKVLYFEELKDLGKRGLANFHFDEKREILFFNHVKQQVVLPSTAYDRKLLKKSSFIIPHEVLQIRVKGIFGKEYVSKVIHGGEFSVSSKVKIDKLIKTVLKEVRVEHDTPSLIEINHTHPSMEVEFRSDNKLIYMINGLGTSDFLITKSIAEFSVAPICIRSINGSGVSFSYHFH